MFTEKDSSLCSKNTVIDCHLRTEDLYSFPGGFWVNCVFQLDASESFDAWRNTVQCSFSPPNEFPAHYCWCIFPYLKVTCSLQYQLSVGEEKKIFCISVHMDQYILWICGLCIHIYCEYMYKYTVSTVDRKFNLK